MSASCHAVTTAPVEPRAASPGNGGIAPSPPPPPPPPGMVRTSPGCSTRAAPPLASASTVHVVAGSPSVFWAIDHQASPGCTTYVAPGVLIFGCAIRVVAGAIVGLPRLASTAARKVSMSQLFEPLMAPKRLGPAGSTFRPRAHSSWARMLPLSMPYWLASAATPTTYESCIAWGHASPMPSLPASMPMTRLLALSTGSGPHGPPLPLVLLAPAARTHHWPVRSR